MEVQMFPALATISAPEHTFVRVRGENPLGFLEDTLTQHIRSDASAPSCLLDGTGHVLASFRVVPLGEDFLLDGVPACRDALTGWLARVAPLSGCEVVDESGEWSLTMIRGRDAEAALGEDGPKDFMPRGDDVVVRVNDPFGGFDVLTREAVRARTMTWDEWDEWRVVAGLAVYGRDITAQHIVNETPLLATAVAEDKGCYPGQETVAKIRNLGRPRRAVVGLRFDEGEPTVGSDVILDEQVVGTTTSAAFDAAIATVRSETLERGHVVVDGMRARVSPLS